MELAPVILHRISRALCFMPTMSSMTKTVEISCPRYLPECPRGLVTSKAQHNISRYLKTQQTACSGIAFRSNGNRLRKAYLEKLLLASVWLRRMAFFGMDLVWPLTICARCQVVTFQKAAPMVSLEISMDVLIVNVQELQVSLLGSLALWL